jgi:transcriptional regulator with XRE-family HTH domain
MEEILRESGIDVIGDISWGTHLCQFYQTKGDLVDILVPYFKAGLENNEFCMWITFEPLRAEEAEKSLRNAVKDLDKYIKRDQIEIMDYSQWYTKSGKFAADKVLRGWVNKENEAVKRGYDGLRLAGNTFWLEEKDWRDFADYEVVVNNVFPKYRMLAVCPYSLDKCGASEVIDVVNSHQFALIRRGGKWETIKSLERKRVWEALKEQEKKFRDPVQQTKGNYIKELGKKMKDIRITKRMSLRELAKHTGLSRSFFSQVEHGKASPSIISLEKIAKALNSPFSRFFENAFPKTFSIVRKKKEKKFIAKGLEAFYEILVPNIFDVTLFPLLFTLKVGGEIIKSELETFKGERFMHVQKGKIELECFKRKFTLGEGDNLYCKCDSSCNRMLNIGNQEAIVLWIIRPPS